MAARAGGRSGQDVAHLALGGAGAGRGVPLAQPQLESQEQAMMGCRKGSLVCWDGGNAG